MYRGNRRTVRHIGKGVVTRNKLITNKRCPKNNK